MTCPLHEDCTVGVCDTTHDDLKREYADLVDRFIHTQRRLLETVGRQAIQIGQMRGHLRRAQQQNLEMAATLHRLQQTVNRAP